MDFITQKILIKTLNILGKTPFTGLEYGLVAKIWKFH